jgi:hypothetical protein
VEKAMNKITKLMVMGIILTSSAAACAKAPIFTATLAPTVTPLPSPTPAPTETEDPFEGLNICRTWQEAENCPITVADFERLPDFVKANFTFPSEVMKVSWLEAVSEPTHTSYVKIHALSDEELTTGTGASAVSTENSTNTKTGKTFIYDSPLSLVGKAFFFTLKENPPATNYDDLVAVFPVNNADGSMGTYTVIKPPTLFHGNYKTAEEYTKVTYEGAFDKISYLPPAYNIGSISEDNLYHHSSDDQGSFIKEIVEDTKNQETGKRKKLFDEWIKTGVIPKELEKIPLLPSVYDSHWRFQTD